MELLLYRSNLNAVNPNEMSRSQHEHMGERIAMNWYYLNTAEEIIGPLPEIGLHALRKSGIIQDETRVCREGDEAWALILSAAEELLDAAAIDQTIPVLARIEDPRELSATLQLRYVLAQADIALYQQ